MTVRTGEATTFVKIYGLQRSGTNWLKYLLERNFVDTVVVDLPLGNKHEAPRPAEALRAWRSPGSDRPAGAPDELPYCLGDLERAFADGEVRAVAVVKPLLAWLLSFHRFRRLKEPDRYAVLDAKMITQWTDRWISTNLAYLDGLAELRWKHAVIDYRELVLALPPTMARLGSELALSPANGTRWSTADRRMRRSTDAVHGDDIVSDAPFDLEYYAQQRYLDELDAEVVAIAEERLPDDLPPGLRALLDL